MLKDGAEESHWRYDIEAPGNARREDRAGARSLSEAELPYIRQPREADDDRY